MRATSEYDQSSIQAFASLNLTPREAEVLFWISQGKSNHEIAIILGVKAGTICKHVEHIFRKLNVENRTSAALVALEACHSSAESPHDKSGHSWTAAAGVILAQLMQLLSGAWEIFDPLSLTG